VIGDDALWSIAVSLGAGACVGGLLGALAALLWRARRESELRVEVETLRARLKTDEVVSAEREQSLELARFQLEGAFGELARESLVQPIREALAKTETQIQNIERDRIDAFATIRSQMEILATGQTLLSRETRNLVTALRRPDVRGQWGEITLKRLVELSGMTAHVDFTEQHHQTTESGAIRPDMIVHMPERRDIVVDVKTPLDAYLAAVEATDDAQRSVQLRRHAQIVGARVRELSSKQYWAQFEDSPEFVVLFLPGDQFLSAAVAYGWKQTVLADNAAEIRRLGEDLYKRLAVFGEHLGKLGKSLGSSVDAFNKAVGSLEQQILPAARRFPELGLRVQAELSIIEPVDSLTRIPRDEARSENT
jgi:DNA recombination protein RmuC